KPPMKGIIPANMLPLNIMCRKRVDALLLEFEVDHENEDRNREDDGKVASLMQLRIHERHGKGYVTHIEEYFGGNRPSQTKAIVDNRSTEKEDIKPILGQS